jgi:hypothetical protein
VGQDVLGAKIAVLALRVLVDVSEARHEPFLDGVMDGVELGLGRQAGLVLLLPHIAGRPWARGCADAVAAGHDRERHAVAGVPRDDGRALSTDTIVPCAVAEVVAGRYDLFLLPPITLSLSHEHADFTGTVSITTDTLSRVVRDVQASLEQRGIRHLVLASGPGGNYVLGNIAQEANVDEPRIALFPHRDDWSNARKAAGMVTDQHEDMHGESWRRRSCCTWRRSWCAKDVRTRTGSLRSGRICTSRA